MSKIKFKVLILGVIALLLLPSFFAIAGEKDFPDRPNPPRLVNDFAGMMSANEQAELEAKLVEYEKSSSTQITVVTVTSLGDYDEADYTIKLGNKWGVGRAGRDNGVVIFAAKNEHKLFIAVGKGLEGVLTDYTSGKIRDRMKPYFKNKQYFEGFSQAADDVIATTKGEFKGDPEKDSKARKGQKTSPFLIFIIIVIVIFIFSRRNRGGGGGGHYISGNGIGNIAAGMILGNLMGGGGRGGGGFGGGDSGGFGGFGGGGFGGGGAGGSWD